MGTIDTLGYVGYNMYLIKSEEYGRQVLLIIFYF